MIKELKGLKGASNELDIIIENILYNRLCSVPRKIKELKEVCNTAIKAGSAQLSKKIRDGVRALDHRVDYVGVVSKKI
jgi:hypothetical protein